MAVRRSVAGDAVGEGACLSGERADVYRGGQQPGAEIAREDDVGVADEVVQPVPVPAALVVLSGFLAGLEAEVAYGCPQVPVEFDAAFMRG